jgi:hypothetical protein
MASDGRAADQPTPVRLDVDILEPVVRSALAADSAHVLDWRIGSLEVENVHLGGGSVWPVSGTAAVEGRVVEWSVVLKVLSTTDHDGDATLDLRHYEYWKRDALAYESGLVADLPSDLTAPRCLAVTDRGDTVWLWLERVEGVASGSWPLERYRVAAQHLGALNAAYASDRAIPALPWLADSRSVQSFWGTSNPVMAPAAEVLRERRYAEGDWASALGGDAALDRLRRFFEDEADLLGVLLRLPAALSHNDAMAPNLFARDADGHEQTVAIDWQLVGPGPVGGEIAQLVAGTVAFGRVAPDDLGRLDDLAWRGYLAGLASACEEVDLGEVRQAYVTSIVVRWGLIAVAWVHAALNEPQWVEERWHLPAATIAERFACLATFLDEKAGEAIDLSRG